MKGLPNMDEKTPQDQKTSDIGIVGGGKIGLQFLQLFLETQFAHVLYVVDMDPKAPAMIEAVNRHIPTFNDLNQAIKTRQVDYIIEVTGSQKVADLLHEELNCTKTQIITHDMAYILIKVIDERHHKITGMVFKDIEGIKKEIETSLETMIKTLDNIKQTTSDLRYLSLNARIEAARAGEHGRGFDVVAQQVDVSAQSVRDMTSEIIQVNANIAAVLTRIEASLQKLT